MNHLDSARRAAGNANVIGRPNDPAQEMQFALMHAAIAQAEAMTRIAENAQTAHTQNQEINKLLNKIEELRRWNSDCLAENNRLDAEADYLRIENQKLLKRVELLEAQPAF